MNKTKAIDLDLASSSTPSSFRSVKSSSRTLHTMRSTLMTFIPLCGAMPAGTGATPAAMIKERTSGLKDEHRLFSVYHAKNKTRFFVITEWDRSVTTVLLPEDYCT